MTTANEQFETALASFLQKLELYKSDEKKRIAPNLNPDTLEVKRGSKYIRVFFNNGSQSFCYCFVEIETGKLYKPATYKAPAKHARGSIYGENQLEGCTPYGMAYLK